MRNWSAHSKIYLIFTSYKLVRKGEVCRGQLMIMIPLPLSSKFMANFLPITFLDIKKEERENGIVKIETSYFLQYHISVTIDVDL